MTTFLENPVPIIAVGIVVVAILAATYVATKHGGVLLAILGVLVLVIAGVGLEWWVVTDVERIEATLYGAAEALEANDIRQLRTYISPAARKTLDMAMRGLERVEVTRAKVSTIRIEFIETTSPPTAHVRFNGVVHFDPRTEMIPYRHYTAQVFVVLRREGGRWLITDHVQFHDLG